ncbi:DUF397 domain-containing protein [Streptomyces sp. NPDC048644]|uniref:DUF397 domain-containing protein n=1 Tax=Streptomyces sp. NPDC048644 TaxID=3365582 RepID=UPI00372022B6
MAEEPNWHTSTYTRSESCIEVADNHPVKILVRDSKRRQGATLAFPRSAWEEFVTFSRAQGE